MTTTAQTARQTAHPGAPELRLPPLVDGQRLARDEVHQRYEAMPESFRAELIEGVVHVTSPVSLKHGRPHARMIAWLVAYQSRTPGA